MAFHMGRASGKHLVTLMSSSSFFLRAGCFYHLCHRARLHRLDAQTQTDSKGTLLHDILLWLPPASHSPLPLAQLTHSPIPGALAVP